MYKETRARSRSHYVAQMSLITPEKTIDGVMACNISLKGIYVKTNETLSQNTECEIKLELPGSKPTIVLRISGEILRVEEGGIGILFKQMDLETFEHLKQIVLTNSSEPDKFLKECEDRPGFK
jgi:hypothetical protein